MMLRMVLLRDFIDSELVYFWYSCIMYCGGGGGALSLLFCTCFIRDG